VHTGASGQSGMLYRIGGLKSTGMSWWKQCCLPQQILRVQLPHLYKRTMSTMTYQLLPKGHCLLADGLLHYDRGHACSSRVV
jgi:hypothetical protein